MAGWLAGGVLALLCGGSDGIYTLYIRSRTERPERHLSLPSFPPCVPPSVPPALISPPLLSRPNRRAQGEVVPVLHRVYDRGSGYVDVHLADVPAEDPDRGALLDRALGGPPGSRAGRRGRRRDRTAGATASSPSPAHAPSATAQARPAWRAAGARAAARSHGSLAYAPATALSCPRGAASATAGSRGELAHNRRRSDQAIRR
jgi:hypothetical protein